MALEWEETRNLVVHGEEDGGWGGQSQGRGRKNGASGGGCMGGSHHSLLKDCRADMGSRQGPWKQSEEADFPSTQGRAF
jgi:hypothetical protein